VICTKQLGANAKVSTLVQLQAQAAYDLLVISDADVRVPPDILSNLVELLRKGTDLTADAVERTAAMLRAERGVRPADVLTVGILSARGRTIRPKTLNQKRYADAIDKHTIVFAIGPAGTGKTYLAMAKAVKALQAKEVNRIILTRPAVEAGERLGFLPGTLYEKIDPYLRPLYDALYDMLDPDSIPRLMTAGTIEIAPLAYMRGRAQPVATPVLTPDGYRPIGELTVGDLVIGSNGEPTPVIGVYPQGEKDIYQVTTQDGASTLASGDHLWAVTTRDDRRRGKPLRVLTTRDMIGNLRASHYHRYELPLHSAPVRFPYREVPLDPYALGLLLGDGCLTGTSTPSFATRDPELAWELQLRLPGIQVRPANGPNYQLNKVTSPGDVITLANPVTTVARRLGLVRHLHAALVHSFFVAHAVSMGGCDHRLCRVLRLHGAPIALGQHTLHRLEGEPAQTEVHGEKDRNLNEDGEIRCEIHNVAQRAERRRLPLPPPGYQYSLTGIDVVRKAGAVLVFSAGRLGRPAGCPGPFLGRKQGDALVAAFRAVRSRATHGAMPLEHEAFVYHEGRRADVAYDACRRLQLDALARRDVADDTPLHHDGVGVNLRRHFCALSDDHRILCADFPLDMPVDAHATFERELSFDAASLSEMRLNVARVGRIQA
jgi:hypothetical protein